MIDVDVRSYLLVYTGLLVVHVLQVTGEMLNCHIVWNRFRVVHVKRRFFPLAKVHVVCFSQIAEICIHFLRVLTSASPDRVFFLFRLILRYLRFWEN